MNDDDLPVLTHVLRTASGAGSTAASSVAYETGIDDAFPEHFDVLPVEEPPMPQIVIGHAPVMPLVPVSDAFRLAQDADPHLIVHTPIAEPHIVTVVDPTDVEPILDTPLDFSRHRDLAVWAARVREAVLDELSTRIDTELDARIAQTMQTEVETAIAQLQVHLRRHLTEALRDVVARAVDDAIAQIPPPATDGGRS